MSRVFLIALSALGCTAPDASSDAGSPDLWTSRVSAKHREAAPRLVRGPGLIGIFRNGEYIFEERDDLKPCDYWVFGDVRMADGASLEKTGVTPDDLVVPSPADLAAGRDPVLAAAVAMAGGSITPEQAGRLFR